MKDHKLLTAILLILALFGVGLVVWALWGQDN